MQEDIRGRRFVCLCTTGASKQPTQAALGGVTTSAEEQNCAQSKAASEGRNIGRRSQAHKQEEGLQFAHWNLICAPTQSPWCTLRSTIIEHKLTEKPGSASPVTSHCQGPFLQPRPPAWPLLWLPVSFSPEEGGVQASPGFSFLMLHTVLLFLPFSSSAHGPGKNLVNKI